MTTKTTTSDDGSVELTEIDYSTEPGPFWYVSVDGTPVLPDMPLPLEHAIATFRREVAEAAYYEEGATVELQQCTDGDLKWAGVLASVEKAREAANDDEPKDDQP